MSVIKGRVITNGYPGPRECQVCNRSLGEGEIVVFAGGATEALDICGKCVCQIEAEVRRTMANFDLGRELFELGVAMNRALVGQFYRPQ